VSAGGPKPKKAPKAKPSTDTPFRRRVSDQFGEAFTEVFGTRYPWVFVGRHHDGHRVAVWIEGAKIREADPDAGLERLRGAALAYCRAVEAGAVWPHDEKANTSRFTDKFATWLQVDPHAAPARAPANGRPHQPSIDDLLKQRAAKAAPRPPMFREHG
jgi:hypothetical protein